MRTADLSGSTARIAFMESVIVARRRSVFQSTESTQSRFISGEANGKNFGSSCVR